jgi:hypothetical protein
MSCGSLHKIRKCSTSVAGLALVLPKGQVSQPIILRAISSAGPRAIQAFAFAPEAWASLRAF